MKIAITGGGTAGHVTPLLAVASELKKKHPQAAIRYIGQRGDKLQSLTDSCSDIERIYYIFAGKWRRYHGLSFWEHLTDFGTILKNIRDFFYLGFGFIESLLIMIFWRPNVVFVKGGFVGLPVGLAAACLRIPFITHDSDSIPGLTNRLLSRFAKLQAVGMPPDYYDRYYLSKKIRFSGIPIRSDFKPANDDLILKSRQKLGLPTKGKILLVMGGSLGAVRLNEAFYSIIDKLQQKAGLAVIWISGRYQYQELSQRLKKVNLKIPINLFEFRTDLPDVLTASDVVVCRAGATTIAELAAAAKTVLLIPNPLLTGGHQSKNAAVLAKHRAAKVLTEEQLTKCPEVLLKTIEELLDDNQQAKDLAENLHQLAADNAAARIVDVIDEVLEGEAI